MSDGVPGVDQYGNRGTWKPDHGGGDSCFTGLIVIGVLIIAVIVGIVYGVWWVFQSVGTATGIVKPTPTPIPPWSVTLSPDTAQHRGNFEPHLLDSNAQYPNGMRSGAALIFADIDAPRNGIYTLSLQTGLIVYGNAPSYTLAIIVNGQTAAQLPINQDTDLTNTDISLHEGMNTIQLKLKGADTYGEDAGGIQTVSSCVNIRDVQLDWKT